ncbi:MAG: hypothetical protein ACRDY7_14940 [Acidimicrobiia bacterium]
MPNLPTPPVEVPVSSAGQAVMSIGVVVALVLMVVAAVRLGRRWSTWAPAIIAFTTLWAAFIEPIQNLVSHMWYYRPGQVTIFSSFGGSLPAWVFFSYCAFYGGFGMIAWWMVERGAPRSRMAKFVLGVWAFAVVTEIVGTQFDTYEYYGPHPFRVAGFPIWLSLGNAAICTTVGVAAARLRRVLVGRQILSMMLLGPAAVATGLIGTGAPTLGVINTVDPDTWLQYLAATISMVMAGTMAWGALRLVPADGLPSADDLAGTRSDTDTAAGAASRSVKAGV